MAAITCKRKRAAVSYMDDNTELDELLRLEGDSISASSDDDSEDDGEYGSRRKPSKKSHKRAKIRAKRAKKKVQRQAKPFPFLQLPAELRDAIYELVLTDPNPISLVCATRGQRRTVGRGLISPARMTAYYTPYHRYGHPQVPLNAPRRQLSPRTGRFLVPTLLAVCQQIHREAVGFLYQQELVAEDTYALHNFLAGIGRNRSRLTSITIARYGAGRGIHKAMNFSGLTLLADCTNLQTLRFDCAISYYSLPEKLAKRFYRDAHHFLEAHALARGGDKAQTVDVLQLHECNFKCTPNAHTEEQYKSRFREALIKLIR